MPTPRTDKNITPSECTDVLTVLDGLGIAVKAVRVARGMSLREVARQSGESFSTIHRVESGSDFNVSTARSLLRWLGAPTSGAE